VFDGAANFSAVGDVGADEARPGPERLGNAAAALLVEIGDDDLRPFSTKTSAMRRPMPLAAPVITATLPSSRPIAAAPSQVSP
jgi:hypothetical protein